MNTMNTTNTAATAITTAAAAAATAVIIKPDDADRSTVVRIIREGGYYPGRMGDPTTWWEIEIDHEGQSIRCYRAHKSGYEGDDLWLSAECDDEGDPGMGWGEEKKEKEARNYKWITDEREFRHVRDMLTELKEEGSVFIR